jgi:hypothetical protein
MTREQFKNVLADDVEDCKNTNENPLDVPPERASSNKIATDGVNTITHFLKDLITNTR